MTDPFLNAHLVNRLFVDIGGRLSPVSIRDQMVRARMAVDRSLQEGLIGPDRPLLVIGAGTAGATAAMHSAARGITTLLIDSAPAPFLRQANSTRWIDPVQYDWPLNHWQKGLYPWTPPAMPLPWISGPANRIAFVWAAILNLARRRNPQLHVRYQTQITKGSRPKLHRTATGKKLIRVSFSTKSGAVLGKQNFGLVLSCVGAGTEKSTYGSYSGFDFWSTDPFQSLTPLDRVLISGGGDGALQDYLRVVTQKSSAKQIYSGLGIPPGIEHYLQSAEDQAGRVYVWGSKAKHDHPALLRLHQTHQDIVDHLLLPGAGASSRVPGLLRALASLTANAPEVSLVFPCSHFSRCYGLNRFLVLLLATYLDRFRGKSTLLPGHALDQVQGVGHACGSPRSCHSKLHVVTASADPNCRDPKHSGSPAVRLGIFNVVIIRHGIAPSPPLFAGKRSIRQPRQLLPYHVA